jgi:tryptophan synthase alpha chain
VAGDPELETTQQLIRDFSRRGASIIEVGIPYSDPIADGPIIQASYTRALKNKITLAEIFVALGDLARAGPDAVPIAPLVAMVSYSIVFRHGPDRFLREAKQAGIAGLIVPDLPVEESAELSKAAHALELELILLVTPTTDRERAIAIARASSGFLYYVSVTGITGERRGMPPGIVEQVSWLKTITSLPVCIGFGISRPDQIELLAPVADGIIVGSAIVRRIDEAHGKSRDELVKQVGAFVSELVQATCSQQ